MSAVCSKVIPDGIEPGHRREALVLLAVIQASLPLDHGIMLSVTEVGVEPTKSPGSGHRPQGGRWSLCLFAYPVISK